MEKLEPRNGLTLTICWGIASTTCLLQELCSLIFVTQVKNCTCRNQELWLPEIKCSAFHSAWCYANTYGRSRPLLLRISSAHAIHDVACATSSISSARTESKLNKYRADDLCGNLICEYFCWMLGNPHFFFWQITFFFGSFHYTKKQKKTARGKF